MTVMARQGGFARGTPVHTSEGVRAIEAIVAGDLVWSANPAGEWAPRVVRVMRALELGKGTVRKVNTYADERATQYFLAAHDAQPFWVDAAGWSEPAGWMPAAALGRHTVLRGPHAEPVRIDAQFPIYRTERPGIGWVQELSEVEGSYGSRFDYEHYDLAPEQAGDAYLPPGILHSAEPFLAVSLFHLEVEAPHTFFVGYEGLLVADASGAAGR